MKKFYIILTLIFIILLKINTADKKDDKKTEITMEEYFQEILSYGIESEVVAILDKLGSNPNNLYYPMLLQRYKEASLPDTKIALANYFTSCNNLPANIIEELYNDVKNEPDIVKLHTTLLTFLGKKGGLKEGQLLLEKLDDENIQIKQYAANSLSIMKNNELIIPILKKLQDSDEIEEKYLDPEIKSKLILALGEMKAKEAISYLQKIINDTTSEKILIMYSMVSLAKIGDKSSIPIIEKKLSHEEVKIQEYAAYSISQFKENSVLPILKKMLKNNRDIIRIYACQGIVLNKDYTSINILLYKYKNDPSANVKNEALSSLLYLGPNGITALRNYYKDKKYTPSDCFVISLAVMNKPDTDNINFLIELYDNVDKKNKEIIAKNVVRGNSNKLDPIVKKLLESEDHWIRIGAIKAVYQIIDSSLWGYIQKMAENDPNDSVKKVAKDYLGLKK